MNMKNHLEELSQENEELKSQNSSIKEKNKLIYEENKHFVQEVEGLKALICEKNESTSQMNRFL